MTEHRLEPSRAATGPGATAGPDRVSWRIHREVVLLLGWGRAILLQVAHPMVARGVWEHSGFRARARARWRRLHETLDAMLTLTFGTEAEARAVVHGINRIHDRVHGRLDAPGGPFPAGTRYSAHDPALLTWVHATCLESFLTAHERFVGPLTPAERDAYCAEAGGMEEDLGIPAGRLPRSAGALAAYLDRTYASGEIAVTDTARALARDLLRPPGLGVVPPARWLVHLTTVGLLPPTIRAAYGFRWDARHARALGATAAVVRGLLPLVPPVLRYWPKARAAYRRARRAA